MTDRRSYTAEERATAIGLAMSVGPVAAGRQLGIPARTVARWTHTTEASVLRLQTRDDLARKLWEGVAVGVDQVLEGLRDPNARLSDKARALEVLATQHQLLTGEATERTEMTVNNVQDLTWEESEIFEAWLSKIENATDAELAEYAAAEGLVGIRNAAVARRLGDGVET